MIRPSIKGFTLLELLVALAIFAVLSVTAWQVFNGMMTTRDRVTLKANQLLQLQQLYLQLQHDFLLVVPRTERVGEAGDVQASMSIVGSAISFTRVIDVNATLNQSSSTIDSTAKKKPVNQLQRVTYSVIQGKLVRSVNEMPDLTNVIKPMSQVVMNDVVEFKVSALNPLPVAFWPDASTTGSAMGMPSAHEKLLELPLGVEVSVTNKNQQAVTWWFKLPDTSRP